MKHHLTPLLQPLTMWLRDFNALLREPLQIVLHASVWRVRWFGIFAMLGNIVFYYLWSYYLHQEHESFFVRLVGVVIGFLILIKSNQIVLEDGFWKWFYFTALFFQLPVFFFIMVDLNYFNAAWVGSCAAMVMIYYQGTDWRLATAGTVVGALLGWVFHIYNQSIVLQYDFEIGGIVFCFAWFSALAIAVSSLSRHKQQLLNTAYTLGVMAHELRTPMAGIGIIHSVLVQKNKTNNDAQLNFLTHKLEVLLKVINHHINHQISNVQTTHTQRAVEIIKVDDLLHTVVNDFPFSSRAEQHVLRILEGQTFSFKASPVLLTQVLNNLIRNAFKAMAIKELVDHEKTLTLRAHTHSHPSGMSYGLITLSDNGIGIKPEHLNKIFEPFFSTDTTIGHGLGLPFCKKVIASYQGKLSVSSVYGTGTTFTIQMPLIESNQAP